MTFHIRSATDLNLLVTRQVRKERPDRFSLDIPGISDARDWEEKLNRYYFSCGCGAASVALLLALSGYVALLATAPGGLAALTWRHFGVGLIIGFSASAIGKIIGLFYARRRLRSTIIAMSANLESAHKSVDTVIPPSH